MMSLLTTSMIAASLLTAQLDPLIVVAKHNGEGIDVRWFPPAPSERGERWAYRVERVDSTGTTLTITHMPLQTTLNVATIRDNLGSFAPTFIGAVTSGSEARRINENTVNDALSDPVSRGLIVRFAALYPEVADILGWRRLDQDLQPGQAYVYRVFAIERGALGEERLLGEARAFARPVGVSAPKSVNISQPAPDRLKVTWLRERAKEESEAIIRYLVYRREGSGEWTALNPGLTPSLASSPSAQASFTDSSVLKGRTYQYALSSVDVSGRVSAKSTTKSLMVSDQRAPLPPLDLTLSRLGKELNFAWLSAGLAEDVKHIEVLKVRASEDVGGPREVVKVLGKVGPKESAYRTRVPGLGSHEYALRCVDRAGNKGPLSSTVVLYLERGLKLKTPGSVKAKLTKEGQVEVSWRTTPGTDASTYVVERRVSGQNRPPTRISPASLGIRDKVFLDTSPPLDGAPLEYRVSAIERGSARSAPSPWVPLADLRRAQPVYLAQPRLSDEGVHLSWRAMPSESTSSFQVQVQVAGGPWKAMPGKVLETSDEQVLDTQPRPAETLIRYRVESLGGAKGAPVLSNVVMYRTRPLALVEAKGLKARCTPKGVELGWTRSKGASSYEVQRAFGDDAFAPRAQAEGGRWLDPTVVRARRYRYRVLARHGARMGPPSTPIEVICSAR